MIQFLLTQIGKLKNAVNSISGKVGSLTFVEASKTVTIPDGTSEIQTVDVDISALVPTGLKVVGISEPRLGNYMIPFIDTSDRTKITWIENVSTQNNTIKIRNSTGSWNDYSLNMILICKPVT